MAFNWKVLMVGTIAGFLCWSSLGCGDSGEDELNNDNESLTCEDFHGDREGCRDFGCYGGTIGREVTLDFLTSEGNCHFPEDPPPQKYYCFADSDGDDVSGFHGRRLEDGSWQFLILPFRGRADEFEMMTISGCNRVADEEERQLCEACRVNFNSFD